MASSHTVKNVPLDFYLPGKSPRFRLKSIRMPRDKRVLKEATEEAKQTKKAAKKPSARDGKENKNMEEGATKQTTSKKRKTKAEGDWDTGESSYSMAFIYAVSQARPSHEKGLA